MKKRARKWLQLDEFIFSVEVQGRQGRPGRVRVRNTSGRTIALDRRELDSIAKAIGDIIHRWAPSGKVPAARRSPRRG